MFFNSTKIDQLIKKNNELEKKVFNLVHNPEENNSRSFISKKENELKNLEYQIKKKEEEIKQKEIWWFRERYSRKRKCWW